MTTTNMTSPAKRRGSTRPTLFVLLAFALFLAVLTSHVTAQGSPDEDDIDLQDDHELD